MADQTMAVPAGNVILEEGTIGGFMFVLASGTAEVSRTRDGVRVVYGQLGPGSLFGELGLLESVPRSATVTAVEDCELVAIDSAALLVRLAEDPMFGLKLLQRLSSKVRALSDELLALSVEKQHAQEISDKIAEIEYEVPGYL